MISAGSLKDVVPSSIRVSSRPASTRRRLDADQVVELRHRYWRGETGRKLALYYGISSAAIRYIAIGHTYADVGGPLSDVKAQPRHPPLSRADEDVIVALRCEGRPVRDIAAYFGRSNVQPIYRVLRKRAAELREGLTMLAESDHPNPTTGD